MPRPMPPRRVHSLTFRAADGMTPAGRDFQSLRSVAAAYMRQHADDYAPFIDCDAEGAEGEDGCARVHIVAPLLRRL